MTTTRTPFGFSSTAAEVLAGVDLSGIRAVVTGASSGIGLETARALHWAGAEVTLAVRDVEAGQRLVASGTFRINTRGPDVRRLDLSDLHSVKAFVDAWTGPLYVLVNNAGIMATPQLERTNDGFELQFATNYFGHFALTIGLMQALADAQGARVVSVSSSGHLLSPVIFDDRDFRFLPYDPLIAYGQSKTACVLLAIEVTRRCGNRLGIWSNALNPGAIATNLQKHTGGLRTPEARRKSVEQGAATSVLLAASPYLHGDGGHYFEDCNEAAIVAQRTADFSGVAAYALDLKNAMRLWDESFEKLRRLGSISGHGLPAWDH
jgi:NAD(P)-dependent dehydrogenase (short-subunit alcohol dehydrogenase family)